MCKQRPEMLLLSFLCLIMPFGAFAYLSATAGKVSTENVEKGTLRRCGRVEQRHN